MISLCVCVQSLIDWAYIVTYEKYMRWNQQFIYHLLNRTYRWKCCFDCHVCNFKIKLATNIIHLNTTVRKALCVSYLKSPEAFATDRRAPGSKRRHFFSLSACVCVSLFHCCCLPSYSSSSSGALFYLSDIFL